MKGDADPLAKSRGSLALALSLFLSLCALARRGKSSEILNVQLPGLFRGRDASRATRHASAYSARGDEGRMKDGPTDRRTDKGRRKRREDTRAYASAAASLPSFRCVCRFNAMIKSARWARESFRARRVTCVAKERHVSQNMVPVPLPPSHPLSHTLSSSFSFRRVSLLCVISVCVCRDAVSHCFRFPIHRTPLRIVIEIDALSVLDALPPHVREREREFSIITADAHLAHFSIRILIVIIVQCTPTLRLRAAAD